MALPRFFYAARLTALGIYLAGLSLSAGIIIGFGLALSSTAFAMQVLEDRAETNQKHGQRAFAILLFQDLAIVPILAIIPALSPNEPSQASAGFHLATAIAAIAALVVAGRYLINPMFRIIANTGAREVMIAAALFVVLGSASLLQYAGLSMAMGAFIAGVLLAESSYRHELEADIEPFRGIFLGLFFVAVGLSLNLTVILQYWAAILLAVPVFMVTKIAIIYLLCRIFRSSHNDAVRIAFLLPRVVNSPSCCSPQLQQPQSFPALSGPNLSQRSRFPWRLRLFLSPLARSFSSRTSLSTRWKKTSRAPVPTS